VVKENTSVSVDCIVGERPLTNTWRRRDWPLNLPCV